MKILTGKKTVEIYQNRSGKEPFIDWLDSMKDKETRSRTSNRLRRMELGNFGDCKFIENGVFELRLHFGKGYRVYFGEVDNKIILLLWGGDKGSQSKDIKKAVEYWQDFKGTKINEKTT